MFGTNLFTNAAGATTNFFKGLFGGSGSSSAPQQTGQPSSGAEYNYGPGLKAYQAAQSNPKPTKMTDAEEIAKLQKELLQLQKAQASAVAPYIDTSGILSAAKKQAARGNVGSNPYYNRLLTQFKQNQARKKTRAIEDKTTGLTRIDEGLQLALETSDINRERTGEDVAANLGEIGAQEEFSQLTEGTEFDRARTALAGETAQAGLATSGLGQQREATAISDRNVVSKEEARKVNVQRQAQETFKTRTFQDLERADTQSKKGAEQGKQDVKIDFDRYIQDLAYQTTQTVQDIGKAKATEQTNTASQIAKTNLLKQIDSIKDPFVKAAALQAYGGRF